MKSEGEKDEEKDKNSTKFARNKLTMSLSFTLHLRVGSEAMTLRKD